jgi:hypothetical protein
VQDSIIRLIAQVKDEAALAQRVTAVEVDFDSFQVYHLSSLDHFTNYVAGLAKT